MRGAAHTLYTWQGRTETADRFEDAYWDLDWHLYELQWERIDWRFKVLDELTAMLAKLLRKEMWFADYSVVGELGLKVECVAPRRLLFAFCKARLTALRAGCVVWGGSPLWQGRWAAAPTAGVRSRRRQGRRHARSAAGNHRSHLRASHRGQACRRW